MARVDHGVFGCPISFAVVMRVVVMRWSCGNLVLSGGGLVSREGLPPPPDACKAQSVCNTSVNNLSTNFVCRSLLKFLLHVPSASIQYVDGGVPRGVLLTAPPRRMLFNGGIEAAF